MAGLPPPMRAQGPPGFPMGQPPGIPPPQLGPGHPPRPMAPGQPPPPQQNPQIKVGWFREGTLKIVDIGVCFERIVKPGNLLNVQVGQFDALLTVRDMDDLERIKQSVQKPNGIQIKEQKLSEFMVVNVGAPMAGAPPPIPPPAAGMPVPGMPAPGMPGMPAPGMPAPGMAAPGMPAPAAPGIPPPKSSSAKFNNFDDRKDDRSRAEKRRSPSPRDSSRSRRRSSRSPPKSSRRRSRSRDRDSRRKSPQRSRRDSGHRDSRSRDPEPAPKRTQPEPAAAPQVTIPEPTPLPKKLTAALLREEIEKRRQALADVRNSCDPLVKRLERLYPMRAEQAQLIRRRDALSRRCECIVMAVDKVAEPYMAWLVQELKKKSSNKADFRADGIKCFESALSNEDAFAAKAFEEGVLMVITVNAVNEQKRSVTVHLCMNELNQIHKNMQVRDALQMIQDQWDVYVEKIQAVLKPREGKTLAPPAADMQQLINFSAEGKNLKVTQYDTLIAYMMERRNIMLKNTGLDPKLHVPAYAAEDEGKKAASVSAEAMTAIQKLSQGATGHDLSSMEAMDTAGPMGDPPALVPDKAKPIDTNLLAKVTAMLGPDGKNIQNLVAQKSGMPNPSIVPPPNFTKPQPNFGHLPPPPMGVQHFQ